ncbi:MAG: hypothetical protein ACRD2G_11530 [Terriglobia bacterium]
MSRAAWVVIFVCAQCGVIYAQGAPAPHVYMRHGVIERHAGSATVKADAADPLMDAIAAVSEEYGWVVDYEDPPYKGGTDVTYHPSPRPGVPSYKIVAGGAFQSTYTEMPKMWSSPAAKLEVLQKIVSDYNQSGNPGNFVVRDLADGSFDVIGTSIHDSSGADIAIEPILDTTISIPSAARSVGATLDAILHALPAKSLNFCPPNLAMAGPVTVGGTGVPARDLLMQLVDRLGGNWAWQLVYQVGPTPEYLFGVVLVQRAEYDIFGRRRLVPVGPATVPGGSP